MFTTCRNLDNPQKMHNERRAHECNIRDKAVKRKGGLRLHQKKYMYEENYFALNTVIKFTYKCDVCEKKFNLETN